MRMRVASDLERPEDRSSAQDAATGAGCQSSRAADANSAGAGSGAGAAADAEVRAAESAGYVSWVALWRTLSAH